MTRFRNLLCFLGVCAAVGPAGLADVPGDADNDNDVDAADFVALVACQQGAAVPVPAACQDIFDLDGDADVDMEDIAAFQLCFRGANIPGSGDCVSHQARIEGGCLRIIGTAADTVMALRLRAGSGWVLEVDIGDDGGADFSFDRSQFDCIVVDARGGDDVVRIDEVNGVFTDVELTTVNGGDGHDTFLGGSGGEIFVGGPGDDVGLLGGGNDRFVWNPGDDTDLFEGGGGIDTVEVNGGNGDETFTITANGTRVRFDRLNPAPFFLDIGTCEQLVLNANGGSDTLTCTGNLAALIQITADGGPGADTLLGSNGADVLIGGDDDDFVDGQQGNDIVLLGAGNDTFQWDPGDGSDTVEGQAGQDIVLFNGSATSELFQFSANGQRLRFTRNVGNIVLDADGIERFDLRALGGADTATVNSLAGTAVTEVNVDLAGTIGGTTGDAAADIVIVNGTNGEDSIDVGGAGASASVTGLAAQVRIANTEGANDSLVINALGGNDGVTATTLPAGVIKLTIDGGDDDDTLLGSQGADVFLGGAGNDFVFGDNGDDVAFLGADADVFQWNPGDGNDTVEGQAGADTLLFFGSDSAENIDIVANGGRVRFLRNVANVTMDLDDVESVEFRALGGADNVVVGDLSGTDVTQIGLDFRGSGGGGDGAADTVSASGTNGADVFGAAGDAGGVNVFGLSAAINIFGAEQVNDRLTLNALGGDDVVDASSLEADGIQLTINGGLGHDVLIGGEGNDQIIGGDGNDLALMGAGDDTFTWNPGDDNDTIEGQAGVDTLLFNGANVSEQINIFANGGRILFTRDVASVVMDLNDVDRLDFTARGGADTITVQDLAGTDATVINLNLESFPGSGVGDGAADTVIAAGTVGDDVILVNGSGSSASILGLAAQVNIAGAEAASDRIIINALAGNDVVDGSGLAAGAIQLLADGGTGDDVLLGGAGNDTLLGGEGDDVLLGGPGVDVLDGGPGSNIVIQEGGAATTAIVTLFGDDAANTITLSRDAAGNLLSNGAPIPGATVANTALIRVFGRGGDDEITLNEAAGALPAVALYGGAGNDTLIGGAGSDLLFGGSDNDTLLGKGGLDLCCGGAGDDTLTGGDADDLAFGEAGNDRLIWNPGDDTDLNEGGGGIDTVEVNGGNGDETFTITANGTRVRFDRLNPAPFFLDIGTCEQLVLNANGGNDSLACTGNLAALIQITADGGPGADTLLGSNGADVLIGGDDDDFVDGQQGNDIVLLGAGNDTFQWDPGDGSDVVDGQAGLDTVQFNGSAASEIFEFSANGRRLRFTRNVGNVVLDADEIEQFDLRALGGSDSATVNSLAGTSVAEVNIDLAGTIGGASGDALPDAITINGTPSADTIQLTSDTGDVEVSGLAALVRVRHADSTLDALVVNGLAGADTITADRGVSTLILLTTNP